VCLRDIFHKIQLFIPTKGLKMKTCYLLKQLQFVRHAPPTYLSDKCKKPVKIKMNFEHYWTHTEKRKQTYLEKN